MSSESGNHHQFEHSEMYYDEDDVITFRFESNTINFCYSHLCRYSALIRQKYLILDVKNQFPEQLSNFQKQNDISAENIILFFQFLQNDFNINQNLTYKQYLDLYKTSEFLQIKKLKINLDQYFNNHNVDIVFQIQIILQNTESLDDTEKYQFHLNEKMEDLLSSKIDECFQIDNFANLPVPVIYRIIEKSDKKRLQSDILYDFIKKNVKNFGILFRLLDVRFLSDDRCSELSDFLSEPDGAWRDYSGYLQCSMPFICDLKKDKKNLEKQLSDSQKEKNEIQAKLSRLEEEKDRMQKELNDVKIEKNRIDQENGQLKQKLEQSEQRKSQIEKENGRIKKLLDDSEQRKSQIEKEKNLLLKQLDAVKREKQELQKELDDYNCPISGTIAASVRSGLMFYAEINLKEKMAKLDTGRSKYIVSQSNEKELGEKAYKHGQPITSLKQKTVDFAGKEGKYYIRAYVVDSRGMAVELVSNPVTTKGSGLSFGYEGKAASFVLAGGRYKLEVWGAQGGKSVSQNNARQGDGGLGGYSKGTLSLQKGTQVYVYVGGQGKTANSSDGAETSGSFPDGGGTKTGHAGSDAAVPGTGGGSTSIRLLTDSLYSRVIVAGGGGGAAGDQGNPDHGGFGGGMSGGNSYCRGIGPRDQGAGTQTGSSPGPEGSGPAGVAGTFGQGATGLYMQGCNSGGGGGGGWYGGGSGGYGGNCNCASGGGGSGWIFTESSMAAWRSGDRSKCDKFALDKSFYLSDASTEAGNTSFPAPSGSSETGHRGDGYAKIIPI